MQHRNKRGKSLFPIRHAAILLIAVGIAESVHAPLIQRSNASSTRTEPDTPAGKDSASPPAEKDSKKAGTTTMNSAAASDDQDARLKDLDSQIEPFMPLPTGPTPPQSNLLPAIADDSPSFGSGALGPSGGDAAPLLSATAGANQHPIEGDGFSGSATSGVVNDGPVNRGPVHNGPTVSAVTPVPEPGSVFMMAIGAMGLLQRRPR